MPGQNCTVLSLDSAAYLSFPKHELLLGTSNQLRNQVEVRSGRKTPNQAQRLAAATSKDRQNDLFFSSASNNQHYHCIVQSSSITLPAPQTISVSVSISGHKTSCQNQCQVHTKETGLAKYHFTFNKRNNISNDLEPIKKLK